MIQTEKPSDYGIVAGVMKMGNIAYRVKIESTSLAFQVIVLTITPPRLPDVTTLSTPTSLCIPWNFEHYTYLRIHAQSSFNNHTAHSLNRIQVSATSIMAVMKMGNSALTAGSEPTSLASRPVC